MSSAMLGAEINKIGISQMGSTGSDKQPKRLAVILGLVLLAHGIALFTLIQIRSPHKLMLPENTIAIRLVTITPDQPKPLPPKPIVKPKIVPIVKEQPKPKVKPLPILAAPKAAISPVIVPIEKQIEKPAPFVPPPATPPPAAVSAPQKAEPAPPKMVEGVAYLVPPNVIYPDSARLSGDTGITLVHALININGLVDEAIVQKTSGSKILDRAAVQAVKKARFKPYRENGVAQAVYTLIPIAFTLDDN
jgi:protein TonB